MIDAPASRASHPEGESPSGISNYPAGSWPVDAPCGRFHAEWDDQAPFAHEEHLFFFFQFLEAGGRCREFLLDCPLLYTGNRGTGALNIMSTLLPRIVAGHWRCAHINSLRGDGVNPSLLGVRRIFSKDAVAWIEKDAASRCLADHLLTTIAPALHLPWILDMNVKVKRLYGSQQGAQTGYNPKMPGPPSMSIIVTLWPICASASK